MIDVRDEAWRRDAACSDADPALFDVARPNRASAALAFCRDCPVRVSCCAARPDGAGGVWGGLVYNEYGRLAIGSGRHSSDRRWRRLRRAA